MPDQPRTPESRDAVTTPAGITTICPQCGATLDAVTTSCGRCGAVITGGGAGGEREERLRQRLQAQIGGAYQLGPMIGRGGMGIVFRAREVALDREVALKVLAFDPVLNPEAFTRFEREARLAARLDHPNIVPIFAVGQGEGAAFYTMRFVRGGSVESLIAEHGAIEVETALKLLGEIAAALDYAHAQGIVHRDIKPANILLSETGHAMVADFGIARAFTGDAVTSTSGSHTGVVGSPAYMAPEQWRGDKPDGRADQYALGVLAFEMLSGLRPFRDASMQELLRLHLSEEPPELGSLRGDLPPRIGAAIRRAMAKEPADRFTTTSAFVAVLAGRGDVGAAPTAARTQPRFAAAAPAPVSRPAAAAAPAGGRRWVGGAIAAVLLVVAAVVGVNAWRSAQQTPAPVPATDTLAERLARELEETRRIALDAQQRAERAEAQQRAQARAERQAAPQAAAPVGHVAVGVRGGTPRLLIDGKEGAVTTPAIIEVPVGRHVVRVEQAGRAYQPAQYVIDVGVGDTAKLVFADVRFPSRGTPQVPGIQAPSQAPGAIGSVGERFSRPRLADSIAAAMRAAQAAGAAAQAAGTLGGGSQNPFYLPARLWQNMSAQEQELLRQRWSRLSPEQQRRAIKDILGRDSTTRNLRRVPPRPPAN
jgi:serine/threonine-protein kinase